MPKTIPRKIKLKKKESKNENLTNQKLNLRAGSLENIKCL